MGVGGNEKEKASKVEQSNEGGMKEVKKRRNISPLL